jgi:hypothetical protein
MGELGMVPWVPYLGGSQADASSPPPCVRRIWRLLEDSMKDLSFKSSSSSRYSLRPVRCPICRRLAFVEYS